MGALRRWLAQSLKRQIQATVATMVCIYALGLGVIAWAATELAADSFINRQLQRRAELLQQQLQHGEPPAADAPYHVYLSDQPALPAALQDLRLPGLYELSAPDAHVSVARHPRGQGLVYLLYLPGQDPDLAEYGRAIRIPVLLMLLGALALGLAAALLLARRISAPVLALRAQVEAADLGRPLRPLDRPDEIGALSRSMAQSQTRLADYARREQAFTRFASHELRTPLSVMRSAAELIRLAPSRERIEAPLQRLQDAGAQMQAVIELFLQLAREQDLPGEREPLRDCLRRCLQDLTPLRMQRQMRLDGAPQPGDAPGPPVPAALAAIVLSNLLGNAIQHGSDWLRVVLHEQGLLIENGRSAGAAPALRKRYGHTIVATVCERLGWHCEYRQEDTRYSARLRFAPAVTGL